CSNASRTQSRLAPAVASGYNQGAWNVTGLRPEGITMSRLAVGLLFVLAVGVGLGGLRMWKPRSESAEPPPPKDKPTRDAVAADRDPKAPPPLTFDAARAIGYLEAICKIGPRISGTDGMKQQQELLKKHFEAKGGKVSLQRFTARQRSQMQPV